MTYRSIIVGSLLGLVVATQAHALQRLVQVAPYTNVYLPWTPPPTVPPPPSPPSTPVILERTPTTTTVYWSVIDTSVYANTLERNFNKNGIWTVIASYGSLGISTQFTDTGLTPDSLYCYRVRSTNQNGSTYGQEQCVYTKEDVRDSMGNHVSRTMMRAQILLRTGTVANADTEDDVAVLLNSATSRYAVPSGNRTWIDYPADDFESGHTDVYDLGLDGLSEIGDISMISIQKSGGDAWCLAGFDLVVNNKSGTDIAPGTTLFSKSFADLPGGCLWVDDSTSNIVSVFFPELRATPGWYAFNPPLQPFFSKGEMTSQVSSMIGNMMHDAPIYWGDNGSVTITPNIDLNALHGDIHLMASVDDAPNPDVSISLDLVVSGGCAADGSLSLNITPANVHVDADLGVFSAIGAFFECVGTLKGGLCVQKGVESRLRKALKNVTAGLTAHGIQTCIDHPAQQWLVGANGIVLTQ
jgi:hypothetical protein